MSERSILVDFVRIEENPPPLVLVLPEKVKRLLLKEGPPLDRPPMTLSLTVFQLSATLALLKSATRVFVFLWFDLASADELVVMTNAIKSRAR